MKQIFSIIVVACTLCGCGSLHRVAVVAEATHDTLYLNRIQYDSVYVENQTFRDYRPSLQGGDCGRPDTVYLEKSHIEYKYKLLRDTVRVVQIDSIPVIRTVEVVKTERYIPDIYKWSLAICIALVIVIVIVIVKKFFL